MLTLEGIRVHRGGFSLQANFNVATGARVAVLGPSGAGKSTLLAAIAGFEPIEAGRVVWDRTDLTQLPPARRPVSILFQDNNLFAHLTAWQNVGLGLHPGLRLTASDRTRVETALARVGLDGLGGRKPGQLSGGQIARVALARLQVMHRPLILLDEPFGALGPALRAEMLSLVVDLASETGATLMVVSHEPRDAQALGGELVFVEGGRAHAPQDVTKAFVDPPPALADYLGAPPA